MTSNKDIMERLFCNSSWLLDQEDADDEEFEKMKQISQMEEELLGRFEDDETKKLFSRLANGYRSINASADEKLFQMGFQLGMQFTLFGLCGPVPDVNTEKAKSFGEKLSELKLDDIEDIDLNF